MSGQISILPSKDGGTPRDPKRIVQLNKRTFLVRAHCEEKTCRLRHAIARVDLVIRNSGDQDEKITLQLDLNGDEDRTDYFATPWGGMSERNYVYINHSDCWQRVNGSVNGWVVTVTFTVPPGKTLFGLSPHYTYQDYFRFVNDLVKSPFLRKLQRGQSDSGLPHWILQITDQRVPNKDKFHVLIVARQHAYETFGSFAIEGIVSYLLSEDPTANLDKFVFHIIPMLNPDGTFLGYEYEKGFEQGTASNRFFWYTIDRLKPDILVNIHNWISPRQFDSISYTDKNKMGNPTTRALELFRKFWPPQTEFGTEWIWAHEPLKNNWYLNSSNPAITPTKYALITYGTQVWVPEFHWFGRDNENPVKIAREVGQGYIQGLIQTWRCVNQITDAVLSKPVKISFLSDFESNMLANPQKEILKKDKNILGKPLTINQVVFKKGLGVASGSTLTYSLTSSSGIFSAMVGLDDQASLGQKVEFEVCVDNIQKWVSGPLATDIVPKYCKVPVSEGSELKLRVRNLTSSGSCAAPANWADAKIIER